MRLTCPNCGAQYEVPDQVIPIDGRDVQCSNCGNTWFQDHPENPLPVADPAPAQDELQDGYAEDEPEEYWEEPAPAPESAPAPEPDPYDDYDEDPDDYADPVKRPISHDNSFTDVLREEAEREARLRAEESAPGLETQTELGLEPGPDDARRRAEEARARMARLRGEQGPTPSEPAPEPGVESRRGLLPDIDEINSTLKGGDNAVAPAVAPTASGPKSKRRSSGFTRGIAIAVLIAVALTLVYSNAPDISAALPQADPALNAYVAFVDNARIWLDQMMARLTPQQ